MAERIEDVIFWLQECCEAGQTVAVDEGGLTLVIVETGEYLEIGGVPEDEE